MVEKVNKTGVKREPGFLYFINKDGNVEKRALARGRRSETKGKGEVVARPGVRKEKGYLYFLDRDGDVARVKQARGRRASSNQ